MIDLSSRSVLDSIFDIIVVTDNNFNIIDVNDAIISTGYTREDMLGKHLSCLTVSDDILADLINVVETDNGIDRDLRRILIKRKDGEPYYADVSLRKVLESVAPNGDLDGDHVQDMIMVIHDVHERALARKALEEQKRIVEDALKEADDLRKQAEESRLQLQVANERLSKKQEITEAELQKEQTYRLTSQKTGFQKDLTRILAVLIALALILPYLSGFLAIETKVLDGSNNLGLLLLQILGVAVGYLFGGANNDDSNKPKPNS